MSVTVVDMAIDSRGAAALLLVWAAKATLLLCAAWAATLALRKRSAAVRHRIWAIAITAAVLLPVASIALPAWHVFALPPAPAYSQPVVTSSMVATDDGLPSLPAKPGWSVDDFAAVGLLAWASGAAMLLIRLAANLLRLARLGAYSKPAGSAWAASLAQSCAALGVARPVRLLEAPNATTMPMTWGIFRPRVVVPGGTAGWTEARRRIVLSHELAHVARGDWAVQICVEVLRACFWFHPLVWLAAVRLRQESERACDDAVLGSGIAASDYASELLTLARTLTPSTRQFSLALAIARHSKLERRFAAMLNSSMNRKPLSRPAGAALILCGVCMMLTLAALRLSAEPAAAPQTQAQGLAVGTAAPDAHVASSGAAIGSAAAESTQAATLAESRAQAAAENYREAKRALMTRNAPAAAPAQYGANAAMASAGEAAQNTPTGANGTSSIEGTVLDPSTAVIVGATISLSNSQSGEYRTVPSDATGQFQFAGIPAGTYDLKVEQPGFRKYEQTNIGITPDDASLRKMCSAWRIAVPFRRLFRPRARA